MNRPRPLPEVLDSLLARQPRLSDPDIARRARTTVDVVRRHREGKGIAGVATRGRSGWEEQLREAHGRGLSVTQIVTALGWTRGTVYTRLSALRLPAHK